MLDASELIPPRRVAIMANGATHDRLLDHQAREPEVLDQDMTPADLRAALVRLRFESNFRLIEIDRHVRDYLVAALAARRGKA